MSTLMQPVDPKEIEAVTKIIAYARGYRSEIGFWKEHHHMEGGKIMVKLDNGTLFIPPAILHVHLAGVQPVEDLKYLAIAESFVPTPAAKIRWPKVLRKKP